MLPGQWPAWQSQLDEGLDVQLNDETVHFLQSETNGSLRSYTELQ